ncbi:hypothetical protein TNCV_586621 [Trichonephila clavipes]|nr:hypothetical protein TNCV_586621 [Trichonephila clavipes]
MIHIPFVTANFGIGTGVTIFPHVVVFRAIQAPPISQSYAQDTKSSKLSATTQTDENITKIKCPPLKLLQPSSLPKINISPYIPSTSASSAQADLLTSTSPIAAISESEPVNAIHNTQRPFHIQYNRFPIQLRC